MQKLLKNLFILINILRKQIFQHSIFMQGCCFFVASGTRTRAMRVKKKKREDAIKQWFDQYIQKINKAILNDKFHIVFFEDARFSFVGSKYDDYLTSWFELKGYKLTINSYNNRKRVIVDWNENSKETGIFEIENENFEESSFQEIDMEEIEIRDVVKKKFSTFVNADQAYRQVSNRIEEKIIMKTEKTTKRVDEDIKICVSEIMKSAKTGSSEKWFNPDEYSFHNVYKIQGIFEEKGYIADINQLGEGWLTIHWGANARINRDRKKGRNSPLIPDVTEMRDIAATAKEQRKQKEREMNTKTFSESVKICKSQIREARKGGRGECRAFLGYYTELEIVESVMVYFTNRGYIVKTFTKKGHETNPRLINISWC